MFNFLKRKKKKVHKKYFLFIIATLVVALGIGNELLKGTSAVDTTSEIPANPAFDDINFYNCVVDAYNSKNKTSLPYNTNLTDGQLKNITSLYCSNIGIVSTNGLEKLTALTVLSVSKNQLTSLDVSKNTTLKYLYASYNQLTELDVSQNISLERLDVYSNQLTSLDVSKNIALTELDVSNNQLIEFNVSQNTALTILWVFNNQLTELDVSQNTALKKLLACSNQLIELDVSKNIALESLDVHSNQLTSLDVSKNIALTTLYVSSNPYGEILYVYSGESTIAGNNVKIPSQLGWSNPTWTSGDTNIAMVDENGLVTTLKSGIVDVVGKVSGKYTTTSTINVVEITSNKYIINEEDNYIFIGSDSNVDTIKNNINVSDDNVTIDVDMENYKLYVKYNDEILKEFNIVSYSSSIYDLSKEHIYVGVGELDLDKIYTINCDTELSGDKLLIKFGDVVIDEYYLISVSSSVYDLSKEYIYIGIDKLDTDSITVTNGGVLSVKDNKLLVKYGEDILYEYKLVSISSEIYGLYDGYIYIGTDNFSALSLNVINGSISVETNKVIIKYEDDVLDEYALEGFKIFNYDIYGKNIAMAEEVDYDDFTEDIYCPSLITYKLFNGEEEVISGNVTSGMKLKIYYYDEVLLDEYTLVKDYLNIDSSIVKDDTNSIITNIEVGTTNSDIRDMVSTNGEISILDSKDDVMESSEVLKTGDKFIVTFPNYSLTYRISVLGDVNGDGRMDGEDIELSAKHIIKGNLIIGAEYLKSVDIDNNDNININDIIKMVKRLKDRGDTNE